MKTQKILKTQLESPLIILGMHRSGTSMVTRLIADCGMFPGRKLSINAESVFFRKLNEGIYKTANSSWSNILKIYEKMTDPIFVNKHADNLYRTLFGKGRIEHFFSPELWMKIKKREAVDWGWKDPRTTVTFPIWMKVFPKAHFLAVRRNGIDVAISLHRRALKHNQFWKRFSPMHNYSARMFKLTECLELWAEYLRFEEENFAQIPDDCLKCINYEDLLNDPFNVLYEVLNFAQMDCSSETLKSVCGQIDFSRLDNSQFVRDFREEIEPMLDHPLIKKYGYDIISRSYFNS